jgi:tetratricopeptide (TPR) repeat protein
MRGLIIIALSVALQGCAGLGLGSSNDLLDLERQAQQAYAKGNYARSSEYYAQLAARMPTDADTRYRLANSLAREGNRSLAIQTYREALLRDPQHARAWYNLMQLQAQELTLTAMEARRYLDRKNPGARTALERAEQLIEVFDEHAPASTE